MEKARRQDILVGCWHKSFFGLHFACQSVPNFHLNHIMNQLILFVTFACCMAAAIAMPYPMPYPLPYPDEPGYAPHAPVHAPVHDGYGHAPLGRVKIQVYRGPSELKGKHGYDHEYFAPWGFYVTQPEDLKKKKKGYH